MTGTIDSSVSTAETAATDAAEATPADSGPATPAPDRVLVTSTSRRRLHLTDGDGPVCSVAGDFREKPLSVYPAGQRTWCAFCLAVWRARRSAGVATDD